MHDLVTLAWRNLGRNRRRSTITGAALAFGMSLCIASAGVMDGVNAQMLHSLTRLDLGHVQVHHPEFAAERRLEARLTQPVELAELVRSNPRVKAASPRTYAFALVSGAGKSTGVELVGVDPGREREVTELHLTLKSGRYLSPDPTPWPKGRELTREERSRDADITNALRDAALQELEALGSVSPDPASSAATEKQASPSNALPPEPSSNAALERGEQHGRVSTV